MVGSGKVGRPRKVELYGNHIRAAEDKIADALPEIIDNLLELARGIWFEETNVDGSKRVYRRAPDRQSNEYLANRLMGKPTEIQEISGPDGAPIAYVDRAQNPRDQKRKVSTQSNGNGHA